MNEQQHRQLQVGKMPRALNRRALRGVKGEAQESKAAYAGERSDSLRLRAPAWSSKRRDNQCE